MSRRQSESFPSQRAALRRFRRHIGVHMPNTPADEQRINAIRFLSVDAVDKAKSGHPGLPLGAAAQAYALWTRHLRQSAESALVQSRPFRPFGRPRICFALLTALSVRISPDPR